MHSKQPIQWRKAWNAPIAGYGGLHPPALSGLRPSKGELFVAPASCRQKKGTLQAAISMPARRRRYGAQVGGRLRESGGDAASTVRPFTSPGPSGLPPSKRELFVAPASCRQKKAHSKLGYTCRRDAGGTGLKLDVDRGKAAGTPLLRFGHLHPPAPRANPSKGEFVRYIPRPFGPPPSKGELC